MKTIVFTGDSHTWGEGSATENPPDYLGDGTKSIAGTLRRMRPDYPSFVALISGRLAGKYKVVNSGIGSCPTFRYLENHWQDFVQAHTPEMIVIQPHTINDWLTGTGAAAYRAHLTQYVEKARETAPKVLLTTVSAVLGAQTAKDCPDTYSDYMAQVYAVGEAFGIPVADVFPALQKPEYFSDNWHVNPAGHKIYADIIFDKMRGMLSSC